MRKQNASGIDTALVTGLRRKIWKWYRMRAPKLPWRETREPYHVFVSEIMLQQTQIPRVLEKYPLFLKQFPTIPVLARAPLSRVLAVWRGMGYNRRALYLKHAAKIMTSEHAGTVPKTEERLRTLPGVGPYSARAILCFAHNICKPFIETNIRRVIIHEFFPRKKKISDKEILAVLEELQPEKNQREWYYALMDYGRDALKRVPNPNRNSKHYIKQSKFEGSPRYIRAKIISYLIEHKKATEEELFLSLKGDRHLDALSQEDIARTCANLQKEELIKKRGLFFKIS